MNALVFVLFLLSASALIADDIILTLSGSNTIGQALAPACAKAYLENQFKKPAIIRNGSIKNEYIITTLDALNTKKTIKISAHGSTSGIRDLVKRRADIAMSSRRAKNKDFASSSVNGDMKTSVAEQTIAVDGLSIILHPDNPINSLSIVEVAQIFSGEITNWKKFGGLDREIALYARDTNSGTWDTFKRLVFAGKYSLAVNAERFESNSLLSERVANDINGVGFVGLAFVGRSKLLAISDNNSLPIKPNKFSVATEDYPLSRRLFFYLLPKINNHEARSFIDFCQSEKGQSIVEKIGFISQNIQKFIVPPEEVMPNYYQKLAGRAERLSLNLRFSEDSPQLDTKALRDIDRLTVYLNQIKKDYPYVYLVGFSERGTKFSEDVVLSRFRALAVRSALVRNDVNISSSHGLGSFMPIANNNDMQAKKKNARVEVWVAKELIQF